MIDEISHLGFSSSAYQGRYRKMRILIHFWGQKSDSQLMEIEREIVCKKSSQASIAKGRGRLGNASNCCRKWWLDFFPFRLSSFHRMSWLSTSRSFPFEFFIVDISYKFFWAFFRIFQYFLFLRKRQFELTTLLLLWWWDYHRNTSHIFKMGERFKINLTAFSIQEFSQLRFDNVRKSTLLHRKVLNWQQNLSLSREKGKIKVGKSISYK